MKATPRPSQHFFVCANRREGSVLGPGCGERGDALYDALKSEIAARRKVVTVWVTKTHCLGICPSQGATVARYPSRDPIVTDVEVSDVAELLSQTPETSEASTEEDWDKIERELVAIEELQAKKVLDLARRPSPGSSWRTSRTRMTFRRLTIRTGTTPTASSRG